MTLTTGDFDVQSRLIEDQEIEARLPGDTHAGVHLLARLKLAELRIGDPFRRRALARRQNRDN